ncbi:hypothetical protein [Terricaulis sp.]|uniref:hypothetical protein n=1 Tax=Terricaulis sp. TaxID=2768686 RepID=UPI003782EF62
MTELLLNPAFIPILLPCLALGLFGDWARRASVKRFKHDPAVEAAGACVLLLIGAGWGFAQTGNPRAMSAGLALAVLAIVLSFMTLGAFALAGETRTAWAWARYIALTLVLFGVFMFALLAWLGSTLMGASLA